jgi:subtilisin family serine protease
MEYGWGRPSTYIECFQWFVAPWPTDGDPFTDGDPARAPDVINNSWSCPEDEGCTPDKLAVIEPALNAADAAGILVVASATNSGPACGSITDPIAIYPRAFTVGATSATDALASFSSRGPVTYRGVTRIGPDVSAPGVNVYSAIPGDRYAALSGTSMAGPHVAGAAALLMSADPALRGQTDMIRAILSRTADPLPSDQGCGGDAADAVPNNGFGWGVVNIRSAIESLSRDAVISGVVRDAAGEIIQGERIEIGAYRYPSGELAARTSTSLSGHYRITAPWGSYIVARIGSGGASVAGPVYAVGGQESQADITAFPYRNLLSFFIQP